MTPTPDKARPNSALAVQELRRLIFSGDLAAGSDHLESELAARLGMSRTPVREAVLLLEAQGLLDVRPRKGVRIRPVSPTDMAEIYDVLSELESLAAAGAARLVCNQVDAADPMDPVDLNDLARAIDAMDSALADDDREAWAAADDAFHTELVRLGGNSRVIAIVAMMADQVRRARRVTLYLRPAPIQSNADHRAVLEAIRSGDADAASRLHREHRARAKATLIAVLDRLRLSNL